MSVIERHYIFMLKIYIMFNFANENNNKNDAIFWVNQMCVTKPLFKNKALPKTTETFLKWTFVKIAIIIWLFTRNWRRAPVVLHHKFTLLCVCWLEWNKYQCISKNKTRFHINIYSLLKQYKVYTRNLYLVYVWIYYSKLDTITYIFATQ